MASIGSGSVTTHAGRRDAAVSAVSAALLAVVAWLAFGVGGVQRADATARRGLETEGYDVDFFLYSVKIVAALAGATIVVTAVWGRRRPALAAGILLGGTTLTAYALREALGAFDGSAAHELGETFPSVHAAVAVAAGLAFVLLAPEHFRLRVALGGSAYAAAVGIASVIAGGHYPSDVVGAYLVAGVWIGLAGTLPRLVARLASRDGRAVMVDDPAAGSREARILLGGAAAGAALALVVCYAAFGAWAGEEPWSVAAVALLAGLPACFFAALVAARA